MILLGLAASLALIDTGRVPLAVIEVGQVGNPRYQAVEISLERDATPRSRDEWRQLVWHASRASASGVEEITSDTCPALRIVAEAFKDLPPITPTPMATVVRDEPLPVNSIVLGGWGATVSFQTFGGANVRVYGAENYGGWASLVLNELVGCWPTGPV